MTGMEILKILPEQLMKTLNQADPDWETAEEIRIRSGKPVLFYSGNQEYILKRKGKLVPTHKRDMTDCYVADSLEIRKILDKISGHSLYAYQEELRQGYFTMEGGHRIGLAGKAVVEEGEIKTLKQISFFNIRIAHERKGCGKKVIERLYEGDKLKHTLILSPPGCGKTTLLRDLIRLISDGICFAPMTVGVADERGEIGASVRGIPTNDLGIRTDVIDGCPKGEGIFMLLRSMAPKVIAVDEIGSQKEFEAICQAVNSGCTILATAHGSSYDELKDRPLFASFLKEKIFERYILLSGRRGKGTVEKIQDREGRLL